MEVKDVTIEVRDANLEVQGRILPQYWSDILLNPVFNGLGHWSITLPAEHPQVANLRLPGSGIKVTTPGRVISGFMDTATNNADGEDPESTWTFEGTTDEAILDDPLCYPTPGVADPALQVDEFNTRTGAAETIIHEYIAANIGTAAPLIRRNPYVTLGADGARGGAQTYSAKWDVLLEAVQKIATLGGLGFRVSQVASNLEFSCYLPTDRSDTIRMNIWNNTVDNTKYSFGAPKLTHAIVGGQGDGPYRLIIERTSADSLAAAATWHRRRERFVDARSADNTVEMQLAGDKELLENGISLAAVAVTPSDDLTMVYGVDWDLGDKVTVEVGGQDVKAIVKEIVIIINKDGIRVGAKVGDPTGFDFESIMANEVLTLRQRIADLERVVSTDPLNVRTRNAQLDPAYAGGLAKVIFEGESLLTATGFGWIGSYTPVAGDLVSMQYSDGQWLITGSRKYTPTYLSPIQVPFEAANGWASYDQPGDFGFNSNMANMSRFSPLTVTKSSAGWVLVTGLLYKSTATSSTPLLVATLPVGFRPLVESTFLCQNNSDSTTFALTVKTNGEIWTTAAGMNLGHINLSNIWFNVDIVYTALTLQNSWVPFGGTSRTPSIGKDIHGLVHASGAMKNGSVVNGANVASIPAGFRSDKDTYTVGNSGNVPGGMYEHSTAHVIQKYTPSLVNTRMDLDALLWNEAASGNTYIPLTMRNSWVAYSGSYPPLSVFKRPDGLVHIRGLVKDGGIGSAMATLPEGYRPDHNILFATMSNAAAATFLLSGNGDIVPRNGGNPFFAVNALYAAGR